MLKRSLIILAAVASAASAQTLSGNSMGVRVPFAFYHNGEVLPAGRYALKAGPVQESIAISSMAGHQFGTTLVKYREIAPAKKGYVRFACYDGGKCFVRAIAHTGWTKQIVMPTSKLEAEVQRASGDKVAAMVDAPLIGPGVAGE